MKWLYSWIMILMSSVLYAEIPSADFLIQEYSKSQNKVYDSYVQNIRCTVLSEIFAPERGFNGKTYKTEYYVEKKTDGDRQFTLTKSWGDRPNNPPTTIEHANHSYLLWNMNKYYQYTYHPDDTGTFDNGVLSIHSPKNGKNSYPEICDNTMGGELGGFFYGGDERIDKELANATKVNVLSEMQKINDIDCYVIMAEGNGCKYKLYISPEYDYNLLKATIERSWWSASHPKNYSSPPPNGKSRISIYDVKLKKINDNWVVGEATVDQQYKDELGNYEKTKKIIKVEDLIMNPDHEGLDSFGLSFIRDGALVYVSGIGAIRYTWQNGELVPNIDDAAIDQLDKMTDEILAEGKKGKAAPNSITLDTILAEYCKTQKRLESFYCEGAVLENDKQTTSDLYTCDGASFGVQVRANQEVTDCFIWDGKKTMHYTSESVLASVNKNKSYQLLATVYPGAPLLGYLNGIGKRIDTLLSNFSKDAVVSGEKLEGKNCYMVKTPIDKEIFRVCFSPEQGYHIVKAEIQKDSKPVYLLDQVQLKKMEDVWVPISCTVKDSSYQYTYERTKIELKPDFTAIKAFESAISDGTGVTVEGMEGKYYWNSGQVVDEEGKNVF